ncbi:MAG: FAD-dependent oxidoreductase [Lentisphaeria bacterium]|nr:FAD-dependent oxidoreductase [Lentisphaeria bacterium]
MFFDDKIELPLLAEADVVVAGTGPGGLGAAVMAARAGAKVIALEHYGLPGGMASIGEVHPFMPNHFQDQPLDAPVYGEWIAAMRRYCTEEEKRAVAAEENAPYSFWRRRAINKDVAALAAEELLLASGVKCLYHHEAVAVRKNGRKISEVVVHTPGGFGLVRGKCFVDATGDGHLAAVAGCQFEMGDENGGCQPMTLCFKLGNVKTKFLAGSSTSFDPDWRAELQKCYKEAIADGSLTCPRENLLIFPCPDMPDVVHFNTVRVIQLKATDGGEFSAAEIEGRRQMRELFFWLREKAPGFENAVIHSMAVQIGVRESRRIKGMDYLTVDAFAEARKCPDAIARCNYQVDIHSPYGKGTTYMHIPPEGGFYEVPFGCIVAQDVDNLTIAGRPISVDVAIHSSIRVMPPACSIGQAAGVAAALAALNGKMPRELDGCAVRETLKSMGARL